MASDDERDLAVRLRGEYRAERRAEERDAVRQQWAERTLVQVAHELARRGDEVALRWPGLVLQGRIDDAGRDWLALHTPRGAVTVHLPASAPAHLPELEVVQRATSGGRATRGAEPTFLARLRALGFAQELDPRAVLRVTTVARPDPLSLRVLACAGDHLYGTDDRGEHVLPLVVIRTVAVERRLGAPGVHA